MGNKSSTAMQNENVLTFKIIDKNTIDFPSAKFLLLHPHSIDTGSSMDNTKMGYFVNVLSKESTFYHVLLRETTQRLNVYGENPKVDEKEIRLMVYRYHNFMMQLKEAKNLNKYFKESLPVDICYIWRIHLLHPLKYINDCLKHFGYLLCPKYEYLCKISDKGFPIKLRDKKPKEMFTNIDLLSSALKQIDFMFQIYKSYRWKYINIHKKEMNIYHINRYKLFLETAAWTVRNKSMSLSPTKEIDFIWHCHMLHPINYYYECKYFANGILLGHNDDMNFTNNVTKYKWDGEDASIEYKNNVWNFGLYESIKSEKSNLLVYGYIRFQINDNHDDNVYSDLIELVITYYLYIEQHLALEPDYDTSSYCSITIDDNADCAVEIITP